MLEWTYPYPVKMAHLPGKISVAYVDEGAGDKTLVFLHGLGSYLKGWKKNIDELQKDFRCIALDFPGYGKSSKGEYPYGMRFFARTASDFIHALDLKNVILVGHSMGGQVAITLTVQQPALLEKLVLVAPAGFETFSGPEQLWIRSIYAPALLKNIPREQLIRNFEMNFRHFPEDARFMISDRIMMQGTQAYEHFCEMIPQCVHSMLDEPVFGLLPRMAVPTLVLFGENDMLIPNPILHPGMSPVQVAEAGAARIPNARLELLRPCGHFVQWECAAAVNRSIRNFARATG